VGTVPGSVPYTEGMVHVALAVLVLVATPAAAAGPAEAQQRPLVVYTRTGGFMGVHDSMKISRDGKVPSTNGDFRLSARRIATLRVRLRAARFPTLKREYKADYPVADGFLYGVTYGGKRVLVNQDADAPVRLRLRNHTWSNGPPRAKFGWGKRRPRRSHHVGTGRHVRRR
jgi:hypothetical protein